MRDNDEMERLLMRHAAHNDSRLAETVRHDQLAERMWLAVILGTGVVMVVFVVALRAGWVKF